MSSAAGNTARLTLGDFEIARILAGAYWWDGGAIFGVVPKTLWSRRIAADDLNRIPLAFNCYLVRTGDHTILIETGAGDKQDARARERMKLPDPEPLPDIVARHGFDPESIDIVINSHLHWDHCGGNTILAGDAVKPAFPRARYFTARGEWEHAHERLLRDSVSYIDSNYDPLVQSGQMTLIDGDDCEIVPGVRMIRAPGHNRDLRIVTAQSGGRTFCFLSDLTPSAVHLPPTWVAAFDLYPLEAIENKFRWHRAAVEGDWVCGFAHDLETPFARIAADPKVHFRVAGPA